MNNYKIKETLASGSTSKVKRIIAVDDKEYAIKIMPKSVKDSVGFNKEVAIHKSLSHPNIVRYINAYEDLENYYITMELVRYELCSFIEADVGIDPSVVHIVFKQLISAVKYLHLKGICHRDVKPENLLLNGEGNVLLSDFGYSTCFRYKNKTRRLKSIAGSLEYMAPEILMKNYDGEKADIWSCGITLISLLTGTLPWDRPTHNDERFHTYFSLKYHYYPPFSNIRDKVLDLIRKILVSERERISIDDIANHVWLKENNSLISKDGRCNNPEGLFVLLPQKDNLELIFTQPDFLKKASKGNFQSSQPMKNIKNIPEFQRLYKKGDVTSILKEVSELLKYMVVPHDVNNNMISFSTTDTKRLILKGEIYFMKVDDSCYITIKKTKGNVGEFRKFVNALKDNYDADSQI